MRCDPRNTGQVCLAVIANDRLGQEELTVIFNFFFFPFMPLRLFSKASEGMELKMRPLSPKALFLDVNGKKKNTLFFVA